MLLALFATVRIYFLVGYGYEWLDYPNTGILHEYYYMKPYVLELRILTNWMIIIGVFCYFLRFRSALYIFIIVFLVKSLETLAPNILSGYVLFVPGEWLHKILPIAFWLIILLATYLRVRVDLITKL